MLKEIAITPEVWLEGAFSSSEHQGMALVALWKGVERGAIVRDLSGGNWLKALSAQQTTWHPRAKEVIKRLAQRIIVVPAQRAVPTGELQWLDEAWASHQAAPELSNIFITDGLAANIVQKDYAQIAQGTSRLPFCDLFSGTCSVTLDRDIQEYVETLLPVFKYSNVIAFIDPYISPEARNYAEFPKMLKAIALVNPKAQVEIHREINEKSGAPRPEEWFRRFSGWLRTDPQLRKLAIRVHIWDKFHDRYLASNLIGMSIPYGFDTTSKPKDMTRWTQLSREDRDDVFKEFSGSDSEMRRRLMGKKDI